MSSDESDDYSIDDDIDSIEYIEMNGISHDETIELLEKIDSPVKQLDIGFNFEDVDYFQLEITFREKWGREIDRFKCTLSDPAEWKRLGRAIERCSSIQEVHLRKIEGVTNQIGASNQEVYQCIGSLYRGLESNTSIESFELDMDLFPSRGVFPTLNLNRAQFKENLKNLTLRSEKLIGINKSPMILQLLKTTSLDSFNLRDCRISTAAYTRIISACTRVQRLDIKYMNTTEGATALAALLRNQRSILSQFSVHKNMSAENLNIIVDGLASNSTLKKLHLHLTKTDTETSKFEQLLCNVLSIEGIRNSNHTLEMLKLETSHEYTDVTSFVRECLNLNKGTNKEKVIRTKIARYYFRGEFDVSPFVTMNTKLLPKVIAMIQGAAISRRNAIYRLLKNIPDLCTFPSGVSRKRKNNTLYSETHLSIMHPNNTNNQHDHQNYHSTPGRNRNNHRDQPNQQFQGSDGPFYHPLQLGQTYQQQSQNVIAHEQQRFGAAPSFCPNQASCQQQFQMQSVAPTIQRQQNLAAAAEVQHAVARNSGRNNEQKSTVVQKPKQKLTKFCEKHKKLKEKMANAAKVKIREENESLKEEKRIQKKRTKEMLRQSRAELSKVQEENKKLKEEINHMTEEGSQANVAQVKVMDENKKLKEEKKRMAEEISEANEQVENLKEVVSQAKVAQVKVLEENRKLKEEKKRMTEEISEANEKVKKFKATIKTLVS